MRQYMEENKYVQIKKDNKIVASGVITRVIKLHDNKEYFLLNDKYFFPIITKSFEYIFYDFIDVKLPKEQIKYYNNKVCLEDNCCYIDYSKQNIDEEIKELCMIMNNTFGIETISSCSGHGNDFLFIDFKCYDLYFIKIFSDFIKKQNINFYKKLQIQLITNEDNNICFRLSSNIIGEELKKEIDKLVTFLKLYLTNNN